MTAPPSSLASESASADFPLAVGPQINTAFMPSLTVIKKGSNSGQRPELQSIAEDVKPYMLQATNRPLVLS